MTDGRDQPSPETHEELEHEREFLLRSLDDLDNELVAGNIDPDTYRVLHDDYTARASAVIQSIADGVDRAAPDGPRVPPLIRMLTIGGIVVFAVLAAVLLAHTIGQRHAGQEITGDAQAGSTGGQSGTTSTTSPLTEALNAAKAATAAQPKSYAAQIAYARALLAAGAYPVATEQYLKAAALDPKQPEPIAYAGYLSAILSNSTNDKTARQQLINAATVDLNRAIQVDPKYPDSYAFMGELLAAVESKLCPGAAAMEHFLAIAPDDHPYKARIESDLASAIKAGKCPEPKTTPTTKP